VAVQGSGQVLGALQQIEAGAILGLGHDLGRLQAPGVCATRGVC
jgi:hypothetical protein